MGVPASGRGRPICGAGPCPLVTCVVPAAEVPGRSSRAMSTAAAVALPRPGPDPAGVTGVAAGPGFQCVTRRGIPEGIISYKGDNGAWLNVAGDHAPAVAMPRPFARDGRCDDAGLGGWRSLWI